MSKSGHSRRRLIAAIGALALLVAAVVGAGAYWVRSATDHITLTAQFESASGL